MGASPKPQKKKPKPPQNFSFLFLPKQATFFLRVDLSGAGEQLVPAHHSLPQVYFVQPHVGLADQGLLHELAAVRHEEQLVRKGTEGEIEFTLDLKKIFLFL